MMNTIISLDQRSAWTKAGPGTNVALVFQDAETRSWAEDVRDQLTDRFGEDELQSTEWQMSNLAEPGHFTRGIQGLAKADIIVIAVHEVDRFPGVFYMWVNLWLQVRSGKPGTLVALVGGSGESGPDSLETRRYLNAVASQGGLDLLSRHCDSNELFPRFEPDDFRPLVRAA